MRLTLRTLLAYLDDTLEPSEIKTIGQKVAESDAAQELIARIKQVTRRRRLTTPPLTGPNARFDVNAIAEYLDNELSSDLVSELEKLCLESDVHLAEIAACHQILTLVLGEPAMVPPTARERMYGLVQGREAIPNRKARVTSQAPRDDNGVDEALLPGLSLSGVRAPWLAWALPLAGVGLLLVVALVLGVAIYLASSHSPSGPTGPVAAVDTKKDGAGDTSKDAGRSDADKQERERKEREEADAARKKKEEAEAEAVAKAKREMEEEEERKRQDEANRHKRPEPPSMARVKVGNFRTIERSPSILLARPTGTQEWQRLSNDGVTVNGSDLLVSLPGYASEVQLNGGGRLLLRGQVLEYARNNPLNQLLLESAVTLHAPPNNFDADLTLERGRIFINGKTDGQLTVRLRFAQELAQGQVWDLTLEKDAEVAVQVLRTYTRDQNWNKEEPLTQVDLVVLQGHIKLRADYRVYSMQAPPGDALLGWNSIDGPDQRPTPINEQAVNPFRETWSRFPANIKEVRDLEPALKELSALMGNKNPALVLTEEAGADKQDRRHLAIYGLGALDQIPKLLDVLNDGDPARAGDRDLAIYVLQRWLDRGLEQGNRLFNVKDPDKGYLRDKRYTPTEARVTFDLLHKFSETAAQSPDTFRSLIGLLNSDKPAIRELAYWQLLRLSLPPQGAMAPKLPMFNAAWTEEQRKPAIDVFRKLLEEGMLPPRAAKPPPPPPMPQ